MDALIVPATLEALDEISQYALTAAKDAGLDNKASYRLRLAVDEIATNIITHGYQETNHTGDVVVRADLQGDTLVITFEDTAPAFDPRRVTAAEEHLEKPLEDRPIGGLGLFLVLKSVDQFEYEYEDCKNRNILVMRRPSADGAA